MSSSLTFEEHLVALDTAGRRLLRCAVDAGMGAPVPTCPEWTVDALIAHQAMVHRWATAHVCGDDPADVPSQTSFWTTIADLAGYYDEGLRNLVAALRRAPPDLVAMTFLNDAPLPRDFWARRQAHETTIHMVDGQAAVLGRRPTAHEVEIDRMVAADGIDELLRGFFTRGRSKLYDGVDHTIAITPDDVDRRWVVHVAASLTVEPGDAPAGGDEVAATISGSAVELYLALWNRGDAAVTSHPGVLEHWHATQQVRWS